MDDTLKDILIPDCLSEITKSFHYSQIYISGSRRERLFHVKIGDKHLFQAFTS